MAIETIQEMRRRLKENNQGEQLVQAKLFFSKYSVQDISLINLKSEQPKKGS